jgi:hypothetical protein
VDNGGKHILALGRPAVGRAEPVVRADDGDACRKQLGPDRQIGLVAQLERAAMDHHQDGRGAGPGGKCQVHHLPCAGAVGDFGSRPPAKAPVGDGAGSGGQATDEKGSADQSGHGYS